MKKMKKYADGGTVKRSFFEEINDLDNVGRLSSMGRGMSRAEAAEETGRSQAQAAMGRAAARGEPEMAEDMSRETAREIARETRMAVPGMGAEVISPPARRAPPRQRNRAAIRARSQAASEAQMRGMTPNYSESMARGASRPLTNAEIVRRRNMPSSGAFSAYAKGGKVKLAGGGSCRGMGKATRGGDYKFR